MYYYYSHRVVRMMLRKYWDILPYLIIQRHTDILSRYQYGRYYLWKHQNIDAFLVFNAKINFNIQHQFLKIETPEDNPEEIDPPMSSSIYKALRDLICKGSFVTSIGLQGIHGPPTTPAYCMLFLSLTSGNTWSVPASHSDPENCPVSENVRPTLM